MTSYKIVSILTMPSWTGSPVEFLVESFGNLYMYSQSTALPNSSTHWILEERWKSWKLHHKKMPTTLKAKFIFDFRRERSFPLKNIPSTHKILVGVTLIFFSLFSNPPTLHHTLYDKLNSTISSQNILNTKNIEL